MAVKPIEKSIIKFLTQEADAVDLDRLSEWIQVPENQVFFENYVKIHYKITLAVSNPDLNEIKTHLLQQIKQDQINVRQLKIRRSIRRYTAVAASIALLITVGIWFFQADKNTDSPLTSPTIVNNQITTGTDKAILTLESGEEVTLIKGASFQTPNAASDGEEIIYKAGERHTGDIAYNTLTIPRGGQHKIILADGTNVWLNSESQIKYPVAFTDGETRQVDLIYGEAYFDVSPSTNHKGSRFKVFNNAQEVEVLGTEFNIKAYKGETNIYTTLVEGQVAVNTPTTNQILAPTEQSNLNLEINKINITTVDIYNETSWKDGIFSFKKMPLKDIMKVLSRWYDMDVIFKNKDLEELIFTGELLKSQAIEEILSDLKNIRFINDFEINNRIVTIK